MNQGDVNPLLINKPTEIKTGKFCLQHCLASQHFLSKTSLRGAVNRILNVNEYANLNSFLLIMYNIGLSILEVIVQLQVNFTVS